MKVTYLVNQYPKASHSFIRREIAGLEACGIEVDRWSIRRTAEPLVDADDRSEASRTRVLLDAGKVGLGLALLRCAVTRPLRTAGALRTALRLSRDSRRGLARHLAYLAEACLLLPHVRRSGSEHVHAHFGTNPAAVALLLHELGGPAFSFTAHGTESFEAPAEIGLARKLAGARFAVAVCEYGRRELSRWCDAGTTRLEVVRCGVDQAFLDEPEQPAPVARRFVCVARLSPEKGHGVLLAALAPLAAEGLDFELVLVGDGDLRAELEEMARSLGLGLRVRFVGWKSNVEVRAEILASRVLVVPSLAEGLPVVIMEALALRRPVIASAVGGIPELVEDGSTGWCVEPDSPAALTTALRAALHATVSERAALGREGARRVALRHDARIEARTMAALFRGERA